MAVTIKALTISQPFAALIASGEKFVENRTWETLYRGWLLIHAGAGTQYLSKAEIARRGLPTRCIVAVARLVHCVHVARLRQCAAQGKPYHRELSTTETRRIAEHVHTEGPFGFVLGDVQPLERPIACSGLQGLWNPSEEIRVQLGLRIGKLPA